MRWWWPGGAVTTAEVQRELRTLRDAGFARAEIALLPMGLPAAADPDAVRTWGTARFTESIEAALVAARAYGMRLDLTVSPGWPLASPAVCGDRIGLAQQKLVQGCRAVAPGEVVDAAVPSPEGEPTEADRLVAVTAARLCDTPRTPDGSILLDEASAVDLTGHVVAGSLRWTAPPTGSWLVFSFWSRPSGQRSLVDAGATDALVIDHFSREATTAAIGHIDRYVLPARLDPLLRQAGGDVFEDSLEIAVDAELWTASLPAEFARRRGYDLTPYLPVLRIDGLYRFDWATLRKGTNPESPSGYDFPGGLGRRIRHDYYRTLNELYADNHVAPLTRWANSRGLSYRAQPYGNTIDHVEVAGSVQVPESEDLVNWLAAGGMTDGAAAYDRAVDFHRGIASGAHMRGRAVVSLECCAVLDADYQTGLAELKRHVDVAFSGGVNQLVLHGFPYSDVPGAAWPGWAPFSNENSPAVSDAWGPRQPMWRHIRAFTDYVARASAVLRYGRPRIDVAFYRQAYWCLAWPKVTATNLADAGYTYGFLSPSLLATDAAVVRDRQLAPEHAGYRALVVDDEPAMEPEVLERLYTLAVQGLPIVVVGTAPHRAQGFHRAPLADAAVAGRAADLLSLPTVRRVGTQEEIRSALRDLDVQPDARLQNATAVLPVHRAGTDGDYYHLFNMGATRARFTAELRGRGAGRILDLWTGTSHHVDTTEADGRRKVSLELDPGEATVVFLGEGPGLDAEPVATPAPTVPVRDRWSRNLAEWDLDVRDWHPGGEETHRLVDHALGDWRTIPRLADVAGSGTYRTTVLLDDDWDRDIDAVLLDLGHVGGTVRVEVNGLAVPGGCVAPGTRNVLPYLRRGANTVTVEIATTLGNRLIALSRAREDAYGRFASRTPRPAGLIGPVRLRAVSV
ncbi:glycosyl hydrolase [Micromonospora halophytica]|uniref:glycosyl hydrolase n=1 Tax=Micromonospora halophytica TaxID=47864 RepID=UPI000B88122C|nr:glycosyl hydrolase [Micromonospora halophytica]